MGKPVISHVAGRMVQPTDSWPSCCLKLLCWSLHTLESSASELWFAIIRIFCFPLDHTRWNNSKCTEAAKMAVSDISGSLCFIAGVKQFLAKGHLGHIVRNNRSALLKEQMWQARLTAKHLRLQKNLHKAEKLKAKIINHVLKLNAEIS